MHYIAPCIVPELLFSKLIMKQMICQVKILGKHSASSTYNKFKRTAYIQDNFQRPLLKLAGPFTSKSSFLLKHGTISTVGYTLTIRNTTTSLKIPGDTCHGLRPGVRQSCFVSHALGSRFR